MLAGRKTEKIFLLIVSILCSLSDFHHVKIFLRSLTYTMETFHLLLLNAKKENTFLESGVFGVGRCCTTRECVSKFCQRKVFLLVFKLLRIVAETFCEDSMTQTLFSKTRKIPKLFQWLLSSQKRTTFLAIHPIRRSSAFKAIYVNEHYYLCFVLISSWQTLNFVRQRKPNLEQSGKLISLPNTPRSALDRRKTLWLSCRT